MTDDHTYIGIISAFWMALLVLLATVPGVLPALAGEWERCVATQDVGNDPSLMEDVCGSRIAVAIAATHTLRQALEDDAPTCWRTGRTNSGA
jgi:hypothetical protein